MVCPYKAIYVGVGLRAPLDLLFLPHAKMSRKNLGKGAGCSQDENDLKMAPYQNSVPNFFSTINKKCRKRTKTRFLFNQLFYNSRHKTTTLTPTPRAGQEKT